MIGGGTLTAGTGNDLLIGGNTMIAGSGSDQIYAGQGTSTIQIDPNVASSDLIGGAGAADTFNILNNFYQALGFSGAASGTSEQWRSSQYDLNGWMTPYQSAGAMTYHWISEGGEGYFGEQALLDQVNQWGGNSTLSQVLESGEAVVYQVAEPLPVLVVVNGSSIQPSPFYASTNIPVVTFSANDYQTLDDFFGRGLLPQHTVAFGQGITSTDLHLSWGTAVGSITGQSTDPQLRYTTLNIAWGTNNQSIQVMIPHTDDLLGSGTSQFTFADGTTLSMRQMLAMAPAAPTFDPQIFQYQPGMGEQVLGAGYSSINFGAGITSSMITLGLGSLMIRVGNSGDVIHISNFDPSNALAANTIQHFNFADGTSLSYDQMLARGFDIYGTTGDETLSGTNLDNRIYAGTGNDTLIGTGAYDTLVAGAGVDTLIGGTGNETFVINNAADVIVANANAASNTVESSFSYVLSDNVQNLNLTGTDNLTATGNDLNNFITGNAGNDTLIAGAGDDTLIAGSGLATLVGGIGNDTFVINNAADVIVFDPNAASNSVVSSISYVMPDNVNNLSLTGSDNLTATGNNLDNVITGNAGNDTLIAGGGNDTLISGTGGGTMIAGTGSDTFVLMQGSGQQTITDSHKADGDVIQFGSGITAGNAQFILNGSDLLVFYGSQGDSVLIKDFAPTDITGDYSIGQFQFADGSQGAYVNDGQGNVSLNAVDANGVLRGDFWQSSDGSYGNDTYNADGSSCSTYHYPDGSYYTDTTDSQGNFDELHYNANGVKVSDSWSKSDGSNGDDVFNADGSSAGSSYDTNGQINSSYSNDGHGKISTTHFDRSGTGTSDSWIKADGSFGSDHFDQYGQGNGSANHPDGSFDIVTYSNYYYSYTVHYNQHATKLGATSFTNDGNGNTLTGYFNAAGVELSDSWTNSDGTSGTDTFNADGSYSSIVNDGHGLITTTNYDVKGNDTWTRSDGSFGSDTFNTDGTRVSIANDGHGLITTTNYEVFGNDTWTKSDGSSGTDTLNADGTHTRIVNDGHGLATTTQYDINGAKLSDTWSKIGGSYGSDVFNADGSSSGTAYNADNSYNNYVNDGQGNVMTNYYDASGRNTGDAWRSGDGTHGTDSYSLDGSSSSIGYNSDGSYYSGTDDGKGNYNELDYNASGVKVGDSWTKADGTYGSDIFNANGSSSGTAYNADNSYNSYVNDGRGNVTTTYFDLGGIEIGYTIATKDGLGDTTTTNYDVNGLKLSDIWTKADGTSGTDTFNVDGSHINVVNDGHGLNTTTNFDASGAKLGDTWNKADGSHGNDVFSTDGTASGSAYQADGSYSSYTSDGAGNSDTANFDANGIKISDSWIRSNGSYGSDTYQADGSHSSYNNDGQGNTSATTYDVNGNVSGFDNQYADGSFVKETDNADGSGSNAWLNADGSHGTSIWNADNSGSDAYQNADGTYGTDTWNADGSGSGTGYNADSSYHTYTFDAQGNSTELDYNANKVKVGDSWSKADGTHGADVFNADGSSSGTTYNADNSYNSYVNDGYGNVTTSYFDLNGIETGYITATNDGLGNITTTNYAATGLKLSDTWSKANGTHGSDVFNVDGSSSGTSYNADGSYTKYIEDVNGHISTTNYDANGNPLTGYSKHTDDGLGNTTTTNFSSTGVKLSDTWTKADGSSGTDVFNANGTSNGTAIYPAKGYSDTYTKTPLANGSVETVINYTYTDGSTYTTDTVTYTGGNYTQTWSRSDGSSGVTNHNASTGENTGTVANPAKGFNDVFDNTVLANGSTESRITYTYTDGSTYTTDTVKAANGDYSQTWSRSDGSSGVTNHNATTGENTGTVANPAKGFNDVFDNTVLANGSTESRITYTYTDGSTYTTDTITVTGGNYTQTWSRSDGSSGVTNHNAITGENTGMVANPAKGFMEVFDNTVPAAGTTESKITYTYTDGSTYTTDTVTVTGGNYTQTWSRSDGSSGVTNHNAATGENFGTASYPAKGYTQVFDNTVLANGSTESKITYTYTDGSTYTTDTVKAANGDYSQTWSRSDGSSGVTNHNATTGENTGTASYPAKGYTQVFDNTVPAAGTTESKNTYTYTDGSTYTTDTVTVTGGNYTQTWSRSDGSSGVTNHNALTGENTGTASYPAKGYTQVFDNTILAGGSTESKITYTYTNGSTYTTDTIKAADSSYTQVWSKSDGTSGTSVVNSTGVVVADSWVHADGSQGVDASGNHLVLGTAAINSIKATTGNEIMIGGQGNDTLTTGTGTNLIAFNKGDGKDTVIDTAGVNNTLSLGGNFAFADLALQKSGNNLILDIGASDSITFKNWYTGTKNIVDLQVIETAMSDFNHGSTDILRNSNVETFNFQQMVTAFDQARAANPGITLWGMTNALLTAHLSSSDAAVLGGDLAYVYGSQSSLSGMNVSAAESTLSNSQFAAAPQTLNPWPTLNTGTAQIR